MNTFFSRLWQSRTDSNATMITKTKSNRFTHTPKLTPFLSSFFLKPIRFFIVLVIALTLTACGGGSDGGGGDGDGGGGASDNNSSVAVKASPIEAGDECPNGGISIDTGIDDNGNGILDPDEVDKTQIVCNGEDGKDGEDGSDGEDGLTTLISVSNEPAGSNCADGGIKIEVGLDDNSNGTLDPEEIDDTAYVCDGEDGTDGLNSLISISHEPAGDNCANGGEKIEVGHDRNNNGVLDPEEVEDIRYVCNGEDSEDGFTSLISISDELAGSNCANGGKKIESGLDDNRNGVLDPEENDDIQYICNGQDGEDGLTSLVSLSDESSGDNCANGGVKIEAGLDDNNDGTLDPEEVDYTNYVCNGDSGLTTLVSITDEPAGTNCANGGKKVETGLDDNRNGVLDPAEVDNFWYVCNGEDGQDGEDGLTSLIAITDEPSGDNCYHGGVMIEYGQDDNRNGVLDPEEVTDTRYVCNGSGTGDGLTSLIAITEEPPGLNCENGGIKIDIGLDDNRNGTLDPEEIDDIAYVCDGGGVIGGRCDGPYYVGGTVSGLNGMLSLDLNEVEQLDITADGEFNFSTGLNNGDEYLLTVAEHPANQWCTVVNRKGEIPCADVTGVMVFCSEFTYSVGGSVSGLDVGKSVTLQNNGEDDLTITANEAFTFPTELADGSSYNVTVSNHPVARTCEVTNGSGEISDVDVTDVAIDCVPDVTAPTIELTFPMNGDDDIALDAHIAATFSEPMDASTITTDTFTLYDVTASTSVNGTVSYDSNSNTAIFDPDDDFTIAHEYTATITTGATDLAHNSLEDDEVWSFTTITPPVNTTSVNKISGCEFIDIGAVATTSNSVTLSLSATDDVGVAAYYITDNGTGVIPAAPDPGDAGWIDITPTTDYSADIVYTFANSYAQGERAFVYTWFKDEEGNVSSVASDAIKKIPAEKYVFFDDFEDGIGLWAASNGVWELGVTTSGPNEAHSGINLAATVLDGNYPDNVNSAFVSPSIVLPAIATEEEILLRFWHWFSIGGYDNGSVRISEETSPGTWSGWTTLATYSSNSGNVWSYPLVDLSAYAEKKVRIGFALNQGNSGYPSYRTYVGHGWYFDDVLITVGQTIVLNSGDTYLDNFSGCLGDWWASNGVWQAGAPTSGQGEAYSEPNLAATVLDGNYPDNVNSAFVSPSIVLPAIATEEEILLRFWHWFSIGGYDNVTVRVSEETSPGTWSGWTTLATYSSSSGGVWTYPLVDLSAYAGKKVRIGFALNQGNSGYPSYRTYVGHGWYFDDVSISFYTP